MSEAARLALNSWGSGFANISRDEPDRVDVTLRLHGAGLPMLRPEKTVALELERNGHWWVENISRTEVSPHEVVLHHGRETTRITRLLLPSGLEHALHVGQFATRELELETVVTPFVRSFVPGPSRLRPRHVVVWPEFAWRSRLALWWACASFPQAAVWVAPIPLKRPDLAEFSSMRSVGDVMRAAHGIRRLTARQTATFASNWKAWSEGDARFRDVQLSGTPWAGQVPKRVFDIFPRSTPALRLSPYDEDLLQSLGSQWTSFVALITRVAPRPDDGLMPWGDRTLLNRLDAWSRWQRGRYVQHRPTGAERRFTRFEYRLTDEGRGLLSELPKLDDAPPFKWGAFKFYAPDSWVMTPRGPKRARR